MDFLQTPFEFERAPGMGRVLVTEVGGPRDAIRARIIVAVQ